MAKYPGTLESNNPREFGIVYATEVAGHKTVLSLELLNALSNAILSKSKTNLNNDAIGLIWFVVDQNKYYLLISWEPKEWNEFELGITNDLFTEKLTEITNNLNNKADKDEIPSLNGYATEDWVENKNYLTEHQDISGKVDKVEGKGLSTNDYTTPEKDKLGNLPSEVYSKEEVNYLGDQLKAIAEARVPIDSFNQWSANVAMKEELSNVLAEEVIDSTTFPDIDTLTREELKMDLFIDMWNSACSQYGKYAPEEAPDAEHPFLLNGLWLTYEEAINVYYEPLQQPNDYSYKYARKLGMRTNICTFSSAYYETISAKGIAFGNNTLETIRLSSNTQGFWSNNYSSAFRSCPKLKTILPIIYDSYLSKTIWDRTFEGSPLLEHVLISELRSSVSFSQCPKLSLDSMTHLVANAANTAAITITVHPEVYAKLTGDTTNEAAEALTPEELAAWQQVLADAVAKNISFATT